MVGSDINIKNVDLNIEKVSLLHSFLVFYLSHSYNDWEDEFVHYVFR